MVQVKFYLVLHGASKTIRCCILGGVYQMRVARRKIRFDFWLIFHWFSLLFGKSGCFLSYHWISYLIEKVFTHTRIAWVELFKISICKKICAYWILNSHLYLCILLVFVLAAFCWTKSLLCNVTAFTGILLYPESTLQLCSSRRFCEVFKEVYFGSLSAVRTTWYPVRTLISKQQPSRRRGIPSERSSVKASSIRTTRTFCPDAHQCLEASNSSRLHLSGRNGKSVRHSSSSRRSQCSSASVRTTWLYRPEVIQWLTSISVSDSRHSYGKTTAIVRTMCDPVLRMFSIRQDVHTKFNRPDVSLHGPDDQASYMEIMCTSSTVRTSAFRVRTLNALLW